MPTILKNTFAPGNRGTYISDRVQAQVACVCHRDGLCAIPLEQLGADARAVASALAAQTFVSAQGEALAALPGLEAEMCIRDRSHSSASSAGAMRSSSASTSATVTATSPPPPRWRFPFPVRK